MKKLKIGQVWRKDGPSDWIKIVGLQLTVCPKYDGGLAGVSFVRREPRKEWTWVNTKYFYPCKGEADFIERMQNTCRFLEDEK